MSFNAQILDKFVEFKLFESLWIYKNLVLLSKCIMGYVILIFTVVLALK